jgi:DNA helicase-2/ATP-dependent DNA helicase PcrA
MKKADEILRNLNESQLKAVVDYNGPALIIAGAGSGKTRVITHRIAYMLTQNVSPSRILALTFTNKAANEMKERIAQLVSYSQSQRLWMGTFHKNFRKILKNEAEKLGFTKNFTIYDNDDSISVVKSILKDLKLNNNENYKPKDIFSYISKAKNNLVTPEKYKKNREYLERDEFFKRPNFWLIYEQYQNRLRQNNSMDFDDLLLYTNILFYEYPDILAKYQNFFDYILVDEYQDTNFAQYVVIKKLSAIHRNICVVGDDSQSVYSFRGARIENILNFKNDYPDYKLFKLEENYRSTKIIVNAANSLIEHNKDRIPKVIYTNNSEGEKVEIYSLKNEIDEANLVANKVMEIHTQKNIPYSQIAVLYRINSQSRAFEEAFRRLNIPYKIYGAMSFFQRKEIKDVLAYIRICVNKNDNEALLRIINFPTRGIGDITISKLETISKNYNISIWEVLQNNLDEIELSSATKNRLIAFRLLIEDLTEKVYQLSASDYINYLVEITKLIDELQKDQDKEGVERLYNVEELINSIKDFENNFLAENNQIPTITDFLELVSLLTSEDVSFKKESNVDRVALMTAHSAKGLEFDVVFIVGADNKRFPFILKNYKEDDIEEERRLFYVALTRAKKKAIITYPMEVRLNGSISYTSRSIFIDEIDDKYLKYEGENITSNNNYSRTFISEFVEKKNISNFEKKYVPLSTALENTSYSGQIQNYSTFKVGDKVVHDHFGIGVILKVDGEGSNVKVLVNFEKNGQKLLLLKYAKLMIIK